MLYSRNCRPQLDLLDPSTYWIKLGFAAACLFLEVVIAIVGSQFYGKCAGLLCVMQVGASPPILARKYGLP